MRLKSWAEVLPYQEQSTYHKNIWIELLIVIKKKLTPVLQKELVFLFHYLMKSHNNIMLRTDTILPMVHNKICCKLVFAYLPITFFDEVR